MPIRPASVAGPVMPVYWLYFATQPAQSIALAIRAAAA